MRLTSEYATRHMLSNAMLKEYQISQANTNKVFCSQWLSHKQVIFGTKCNKLMVLDVNTKHLDQIPSLASSENSSPPDQECGIHSIEMNPSQTLLATGARNSNDVAVYRLPTLDPICVGENAHSDWIFDQVWISEAESPVILVLSRPGWMISSWYPGPGTAVSRSGGSRTT